MSWSYVPSLKFTSLRPPTSLLLCCPFADVDPKTDMHSSKRATVCRYVTAIHLHRKHAPQTHRKFSQQVPHNAGTAPPFCLLTGGGRRKDDSLPSRNPRPRCSGRCKGGPSSMLAMSDASSTSMRAAFQHNCLADATPAATYQWRHGLLVRQPGLYCERFVGFMVWRASTICFYPR